MTTPARARLLRGGAALFLVLLAVSVRAGEIPVGRFSAQDLSGWEEQTFRGKEKTRYTLVPDGGRTVLQATSRGTASGLIRKLTVDLKSYPLLRWSWKVLRSLPGEDVARKGGDDFAARVYLVFPRTFFWRLRAITYVWSSRLPVGTFVASPYTGNAIVVALESGDRKAGTWVSEERNVYEDYRRAFGEDPPELGGVAVMTDTDDTGDQATAWYGDISLVSR